MIQTDDIRKTIAVNITELRRAACMTQLELAEKLNYSDKAVSKWERSESVPDIIVLKSIADLFSVSIDYLVSPEHDKQTVNQTDAPRETPEITAHMKNKYRMTHILLVSMCILLVWLIAIGVFIMLELIFGIVTTSFLPYVYALPISFIVWLVLNSIWFSGTHNFIIISGLVWSLLFAVHITFILCGITECKLALIYLLGIPGQAIIILWSAMSKHRKLPVNTNTKSNEEV